MDIESEYAAQDIAGVVRPYSNLDAHNSQGPIIIERGDESYAFDKQGKRFLEGTSGL